jgi:hypothetical protein
MCTVYIVVVEHRLIMRPVGRYRREIVGVGIP